MAGEGLQLAPARDIPHFRLPSNEAETARCPSDVIATAVTELKCAVRVGGSAYSPDPTPSTSGHLSETAHCPSGVTATALTRPVVTREGVQSLPAYKIPHLLVSAARAEPLAYRPASPPPR